MNVLKKLIKNFIILFSLFLFLFTIDGKIVEGASHPYDVPSSVQNNWNQKYGDKSYNSVSERRLMYDVYFNKYFDGGYRIVNRNFNDKGSQPYLNFRGWAILAGYTHHNSNNNETYIVAQEIGNNSNVKIYSTLKLNLSATQDLAYNRRADGTLWNPCPSDAKNRYSDDCNMYYESVGFDAYLPLQELFPDISQSKSYRLWLVKKVENNIVYTPLIVPFNFSNLSYQGGEISLSSGTNTNKLTMMTDLVLRRRYKGQPAASVIEELGSDRYFKRGQTYTMVNSDESGTAVWYGVRSPHDNNQTRYAQSGYWGFGGDQAVLKFIPDNKPPEHIYHALTGNQYTNGNDYWAQPNTEVTITLRQYDKESGNKHQYLRLYGSGVDVRSRHDFANSATHNQALENFRSSHVSINSARRTENTQYGRVEWKATPKTHGHNYDIQYFYRDNANNTLGYESTGMRLRVDGVAPTLNDFSISGYKYHDGSVYWIRPNDKLDVILRQHDGHSGNKFQYLRINGNGEQIRARHDFNNSSTTNLNQVSTFPTSTNNVAITATKRTENTAYGKVNWTITGKTHGNKYKIWWHFRDNVNNDRGYDTGEDSLAEFGVDGEAPLLDNISISGEKHKSGVIYWVKPDDKLTVSLRQHDGHSGNKFQYLKITGNGEDVRASHDFNNSSTTNLNQVSTFPTSTNNITITAAKRTENSAYGKVDWTITPRKHGLVYNLWWHFRDNVNNDRGYDTGIGSFAKIGADGVGPTIQFRNQDDTKDFKNREWSADDIVVRLKFSDEHSGYKRSRYAWSKSSSMPSENQWSNWTTSSNYLTSAQTKKGEWYLHVQAEDHVGNRTTTKSYYYKLNHPPEADMEYKVQPPNPQKDKIYEGDELKVCVTVRDEDDDLLNVKFYYIYKNEKVYFGEESGVKSGSTVCKNFTIGENDTGRYDIGSEVSDGIFEVNPKTWINALKLFIVGRVNHTPEWEKIHLELGHTLDKFYSGEKFLLEADVADYPIDDIKAIFRAYQADGKPIRRTAPLYFVTNVLYDGELFDEKWLHYPTNIRKGPAYFDFEVTYSNGVKKETIVPIEIIIEGNVFDVYKFHRRY